MSTTVERWIGRVSIAVIAACCVLQAMTASWYSTWIDDVMQMDPGVNWALGHGFVSYAQGLPGDKVFAYNNSLYPFLLGPWVKLLGIGYTQVRSFDLLLTIAAATLAALACRRMDLLKGAAAALAAVAIAVCIDSAAFVFRSGRADSATMLAFAVLMYAYALSREEKLHWAWIGVAALLIAPSGIQGLPLVVGLGILARICDARFRWSFALAAWAGTGLGLALLLAYYFTQGMHVIFLQTTFGSGQTVVGASLQSVVLQDAKAFKYLAGILERMAPMHLFSEIVRDPSARFLLAGLVAAVLAGKPGSRSRSLAVTVLAVSCAIPALMLLAGRYPYYYAWMASIPAAIGFVAVTERLAAERAPRWVMGSMIGLGACAVLQGFPLRVAQDLRSFGPMGHAQVAAMCDEQLREDDVVYGANAIYFEAKRRDLGFFGTLYARGRAYPEMSEKERDSVTLVLVSESEVEESLARFPGAWTQVGDYQIHINMDEWLSKPTRFLAFRRQAGP